MRREVRRPWPGASQLLIDMKLMYCVFPTAIPEVGMMPVSDRAKLDAVDDLFDSAQPTRGEPEYLLFTTPFGMATVSVSERSEVRNMRVVPPLPAAHAAIADCVAEGHQHLVVRGSPLSHMIPRSVPVIAKRLMVSLRAVPGR